MRISIVGTGYVGLSTGVGFAVKGNKVICVDVVKEKIEKINRGIPPIYEPGIEERLKDVISRGLFKATTKLEDAVTYSDVSFISVGTPMGKDGSINLRYIEEVSKQLGEALRKKDSYHVFVVKSTVVPGTTEEVVRKNLEEASGKKAGPDFGICTNPEFLREGKALEDFLNPDRIVIGELDERSGNVVDSCYANFDSRILRTKIKVAEMIKYAANAFLATKISFTNEMGNMCKNLGIDVYDVMEGVGLDKRISPLFLWAGAGYGGSCFPKDVEAIIAKSVQLGHEPKLLRETHQLNLRQKTKIIDLLESRMDLNGKRIAVLGLAFKPESDDIREAPSIDITKKLTEKGARIVAYDPKAMENFRKLFPDIEYADSAGKALLRADACLIVTEWEEFKSLTDDDFRNMSNRVIIEGRKVLDPKKVTGFEGLCW